MITILNKIVNYIADFATCPACGGTGGSAGNPDPKDNWICSTCGGSGEVSSEDYGDDPPEDE